MHDLQHVDALAHELGLIDVAWNPVEDEHVFVRLVAAQDGLGVDVRSPHADGNVIGHELAPRGVLVENLAQFGVDVETSKDLAARQVIEPGDLAEDLALRALARSGRAEEQNRLVAIVHGRTPRSRRLARS